MESILQQLDHLSALEEKEKQQLKKVEHKIGLLEAETKEGGEFSSLKFRNGSYSKFRAKEEIF
jgi:hypothetical protein